jgi:hypothetical protein
MNWDQDLKENFLSVFKEHLIYPMKIPPRKETRCYAYSLKNGREKIMPTCRCKTLPTLKEQGVRTLFLLHLMIYKCLGSWQKFALCFMMGKRHSQNSGSNMVSELTYIMNFISYVIFSNPFGFCFHESWFWSWRIWVV